MTVDFHLQVFQFPSSNPSPPEKFSKPLQAKEVLRKICTLQLGQGRNPGTSKHSYSNHHQYSRYQRTTALAAILDDISSEEPLTQPRRSGRKTSAPTIIQPITSQIATKPKRIRTAGSVDVVQGDAGSLETQEARKDIGKAKTSKGKKSKGTKIVIQPLPLQTQQRTHIAVLPSPTSYTPMSLAPASLASAALAPAALASVALAPAALASAAPAPGSLLLRLSLSLQEDDSEDGSMVGEEEALHILTAQKEALNGPISSFDAAHSDNEEQRHLARAKVLSTAEFPPLGREPSSSESTNQKEGVWKLGKIPQYSRNMELESPPPAKKHQDENHLSTATYIPHTPSPTPLENDPRNSGSDNEEEDTKNPWGTIDGRAPSIYTTPATAYGRFPWVSGLNAESFGEGQDPDQVKEWLIVNGTGAPGIVGFRVG
ncbi:hypothetical protein EV360DRAFT_76999 [Lentinula raphanica]|nr:hypothetical protein EV360DRAFT_76999 [Lentinula raphanica]